MKMLIEVWDKTRETMLMEDTVNAVWRRSGHIGIGLALCLWFPINTTPKKYPAKGKLENPQMAMTVEDWSNRKRGWWQGIPISMLPLKGFPNETHPHVGWNCPDAFIHAAVCFVERILFRVGLKGNQNHTTHSARGIFTCSKQIDHVHLVISNVGLGSEALKG